MYNKATATLLIKRSERHQTLNFVWREYLNGEHRKIII